MEGEREGEERERMDTFRAACSELNVVITFVLLVAGSNHFGIAGWYSMRAMEHGLLVILLVLLTASSETLLFIEFSFFLSPFSRCPVWGSCAYSCSNSSYSVTSCCPCSKLFLLLSSS